MAGFFKSLFGKKPEPKPQQDDFTQALMAEIANNFDPNNVNDRLGVALWNTIKPQLELLGFELETVPAMEPFTSKKFRGALLGLATGVIEAEGIDQNKDILIDTLIGAFAIVFSDEIGRDLSLQTFQELMSQDEEIMAASEWSRADVKGVYDSGGSTTAAGLYFAAKNMI
jgi:hypothetical protein